MIVINGTPLERQQLPEFAPDSMETKIANMMFESGETFSFSSLGQLRFELRLRTEIINASYELYRSRLQFRVFRDTICNEEYWNRMNDGGFSLKSGVRPSDAINDIFINSHLYGTECATAMVIVYYRALMNVFPTSRFNELFSHIYLMDWTRLDPKLREIGLMRNVSYYLPGDRRYIANPDVDPLTPQWQGENVIDMGDGLYYGHGMGIRNTEAIIRALNANRRPGAQTEAYLMDSAGRPNFSRLYSLYSNTRT
ncbi:MAG: protein-glutamine gamma-glutamyltransferase [Christensenellales bacterium]